jgi:rhomboid protease GluP
MARNPALRDRYNECVETRRMCPNCRAFITTSDKVCPYCDIKLEAPAIARRAPADVLGGLIPHARFTTIVILLINAGFYLAEELPGLISGSGSTGLPLFQAGAKYGPAIHDGQWWRLLTAGFLHGGILHLLMNSWVLFDLGPQVNQAFGTPRFLTIYFVSSVTGFLASLYWSPAISIGASAGLCGLIGAMIAFGTRDRSAFGAALRRQYIQWVIYLLIFGLLPGFNVDNAAHIGGLAGGFVVAYIAGTPGFSQAAENVWRLAAGLSLAATAYAFFQMFLHLTSTPV